jgi:SAM-dependent methyltransferase
MSAPKSLTDRSALARQRARADTATMFLQESAADEVQDRLSVVNRPFSKIAIITPFRDIWEKVFPEAWIVPDDETLNLTPETCDLVVHSLSLHWADDPVGQLIQCRRALKPDGLFLGATLGGRTLEELRSVLAEAEIAQTGGLSPRVVPMAEIRDLGALMQRAGFALPVADSVPLPATYRDMHHLMRDLRQMGEGNALAARRRKFLSRTVLTRAADAYSAHFPAPGDRIRATFELVMLTGWAPDASQPKPLRPGSAQQRLADALGTPEIKLPD